MPPALMERKWRKNKIIDELYIYWFYCIQGISETTGASSDIYCQSNNDNYNGTSCTFYVESIQVKHRGELGREYRKRE
jgi:hypothetical protein